MYNLVHYYLSTDMELALENFKKWEEWITRYNTLMPGEYVCLRLHRYGGGYVEQLGKVVGRSKKGVQQAMLYAGWKSSRHGVAPIDHQS